MTVEIERKFLVLDDTWRQAADTGRRLRQAYLSDTLSNTIRIRVVNDNEAWLTIKSPHRGLSRDEFEYDVPIADGLELLQLRHGGIIDKTRYAVPFGGFTWEVDVFSGDNDGLVIAEVELKHETQQPPQPSWIGSEVTHDLRYQNSQLATIPFGTWSRD